MSGIRGGQGKKAFFHPSAVKLLFDHNLSYRLVSILVDLYPDSTHVRDVKLSTATDETVWRYACDRDYIIVSKDSDFHQRSLIQGLPPKVIWIGLGNCSTADVADLLRRRRDEIIAFAQDNEAAFLILSA